MPGPIARRMTSGAVLVTLLVALDGCAGGSAGPPRSTVAQTSTTYATVPARTTTTTMAPPPDDTSASGDEGGDPDSSTSDDPNQERIHEIEFGDYLVAIARDYDVPIDYLPAYNGWVDGLGHALVPGDTIRIPPADWTPEGEGGDDTTDASEPAASSEDGCGTYTIRRGDTPARVASAHDVTVAELDAANAGTRFYGAFVVGIDIVIPC